MKSIEKVKRQRRIKNIAPYCDNPTSKENMALQKLVEKGAIVIHYGRRERKQAVKKTMRRMNRSGR